MGDEAIRSLEEETLRAEFAEDFEKEWDEEEEIASPEFHDQYAFDPRLHAHTLNGKPLHGVTTVLQVINKPALIQWAADEVTRYIEQKIIAAETGTILDSLPQWLQEARSAHRKKKEKAGNWGTNVHKAIEIYIAEKMGKPLHETVVLDEVAIGVIDKFKKWAEDNKVTFLESEKHVWSRNLWVGGILDLVFQIDGKTYVGDIKTSTGIYDEAFYQMAAYELCLRDMGTKYDIDGYMVINLRKDGVMDMKLATNLGVNRDAFLAALMLHKIRQSIK